MLNFPDQKALRVLRSAAEKELAWLRTYGRPRFPFERAYRETSLYKKQEPKEHYKSLEEHLKLSPYFIPTHSKLNRSVLRHPDLQHNNIFISEDFSITGLIDWQRSTILPTFLVAGIPKSFQSYDDEESLSFVLPKLPDHIDTVDEGCRARELEQFRRCHVHFFYLGFTRQLNGPHWHAIKGRGLLRRRIFDHAGSPWEGLNTPLQMEIVQVTHNWPNIASPMPDGTVPACPVVVTELEAQKPRELADSLREVDSEMEHIHDVLGIASDGWTPNEAFDTAKKGIEMIKEEGLKEVADDPWLKKMSQQHWPFDDFDEDE
ncbi:hypothetical protein BU23DRAFT_2664 [Bimuria novae-zelandiae CBS 107.79]|uniref:Aminoglycoside phosphotransferase domain-containing protein n=1 Tax=Bimuria novae-zelandiae CBS 107.79 TaxID=1447943 RepID=A0A6A5VRZ0_9PLEO|nr:hypothetical protein BU23DRAFT_2664 [Bimuria novae-zelandiae CBS 107.79]